MSHFLLILPVIALSFVTVFGDFLVKASSVKYSSFLNLVTFAGCCVYALTGIGWFYVMQHINLSSLGVVYGVTCAVLLTLTGYFVFHEKISGLDFVGLALGITSIIILTRFG